jgi:hypothetical protein
MLKFDPRVVIGCIVLILFILLSFKDQKPTEIETNIDLTLFGDNGLGLTASSP